MTSFILWLVLLGAVVAWYVWTARRSRHIVALSEDVASQALPTIGTIAEEQHMRRFGRAPTNTPGPAGSSVWYPPPPKKRSA